jgi:hypothetical protein
MKRPSADDMNLASEWLDCYDDGYESDDEGYAVKRVAAWLREQAQQSMERETARLNNVPVKRLRAKMREMGRATKP